MGFVGSYFVPNSSGGSTIQKNTKQQGRPKNYFEEQIAEMKKGLTGKEWRNVCHKKLSQLFSKEITNIRNKDSTATLDLAAVCFHLINMLEWDSRYIESSFSGVKLAAATIYGSDVKDPENKLGETIKQFNGTHELVKSQYDMYKKHLLSYKDFILKLMENPELKNNEFLKFIMIKIE